VPTARYDSVAEFYEAGWRDQYDDAVSVALFNLLEPLRAAQVLDLACGHGRISRELARRGAQVVGLDLSGAMLDRARAIEAREGLEIRYVQGDAASPSVLEGEAFDTVVCSFGLSDIDDLDRRHRHGRPRAGAGGVVRFLPASPLLRRGNGGVRSMAVVGQLLRRGLVASRRCPILAASAGRNQPPHAVDVRQNAPTLRSHHRPPRRAGPTRCVDSTVC
jgi:SAM-dependent methyltransferase